MILWLPTIACTLAVFLGISLLSWGTDGWRAWTAETARRIDVQNNPISMPNATLLYAHNDQGRGIPLTLMELIYTRCPTVCLDMGIQFKRLQEKIINSKYQSKIKLLSISFDPRDSLQDLESYLQRFMGNPQIWFAAKFSNTKALDAVKQELGVIVIPEPQVGFIHNAAIYVIRQNKVVAILDHDDHKGIWQAIEQYADIAVPNRTH